MSVCKHCGKPESDERRQFEVAPEPPFKVGDWVMPIALVGYGGIAAPVRWVDGTCVWLDGYTLAPFGVVSLRHATPDEIKAVTHFTPKSGMLLQRKRSAETPWIVDRIVGNTFVRLRQLTANGNELSRYIDDFAHADWTILDAYTLQGVR